MAESTATRRRRHSLALHDPAYVPRVSFDQLTPTLPALSFTLQCKSRDYRRTRWSRTFLVATELNTYSDYALEWVLDKLVDDGDEVVALRVVAGELARYANNYDKRGRRGSMLFGNGAGHAMGIQEQVDQSRDDARRIMNRIMEKNQDKKISIVVEFIIGKVPDTFQRMIKMYQPSLLVVGTRERSHVKGFLLGGISRYFLNNCPIPVVVVRPEKKKTKKQAKKSPTPKRRHSLSTDVSTNAMRRLSSIFRQAHQAKEREEQSENTSAGEDTLGDMSDAETMSSRQSTRSVSDTDGEFDVGSIAFDEVSVAEESVMTSASAPQPPSNAPGDADAARPRLSNSGSGAWKITALVGFKRRKSIGEKAESAAAVQHGTEKVYEEAAGKIEGEQGRVAQETVRHSEEGEQALSPPSSRPTSSSSSSSSSSAPVVSECLNPAGSSHTASTEGRRREQDAFFRRLMSYFTRRTTVEKPPIGPQSSTPSHTIENQVDDLSFAGSAEKEDQDQDLADEDGASVASDDTVTDRKTPDSPSDQEAGEQNGTRPRANEAPSSLPPLPSSDPARGTAATGTKEPRRSRRLSALIGMGFRRRSAPPQLTPLLTTSTPTAHLPLSSADAVGEDLGYVSETNASEDGYWSSDQASVASDSTITRLQRREFVRPHATHMVTNIDPALAALSSLAGIPHAERGGDDRAVLLSESPDRVSHVDGSACRGVAPGDEYSGYWSEDQASVVSENALCTIKRERSRRRLSEIVTRLSGPRRDALLSSAQERGDSAESLGAEGGIKPPSFDSNLTSSSSSSSSWSVSSSSIGGGVLGFGTRRLSALMGFGRPSPEINGKENKPLPPVPNVD
ncbi:uncharacterized protein VTP21DRAFT_11730 [Calcarisporiella thermophila]|uniref:uncharacterized protein n=1 Tax=Calcarisporiella thermophila TaxID=911321 RepID=UPI0037422F82